MKIVIDIPESYYAACMDWDNVKVATIDQTIIANGKPVDVRPTLIINGEVIYLTQEHIDVLKEYEERKTVKEIMDEMFNSLGK